ncbi:MAG: hypothetical protein EA397_15305 [Deltaproteobacteria bacterium]|nr:MAG: hypothetical protein EA397_15305 [Deltaproteobacteria bacterium]
MIRRVRCSADLLESGSGAGADLWMASPYLRAVLRHPSAAHTRTDIGGGTLLDAAPWGSDDVLFEAIPMVEGGWLSDIEQIVVGDRVVLRGQIRAIPGLPPPTSSGERVVRWRMSAEGPWIRVEGADALLLHPRSPASRDGDRLYVDDVTIAGSLLEDLGGAVIYDAQSPLLIAPTDEAMDWLHPEGVPISGHAPEARHLELWSQDRRIARVPLVDEDFALRAPAEVDRVRATGSGRAPSPFVAPREGLDLQVGPRGGVQVRPLWTGRPRAFRVQHQGQVLSGARTLPEDGGTVWTGPGSVRLTIEGEHYEVEVPVDVRPRLQVSLQGSEWPRAKVSWDVAGDRDLTRRASNHSALRGAGVDFAVLTATFDISTGAGSSDDALRWQAGARLVTDQGFPVVAWPMSRQERRPAGGLPSITGSSLEEVLALLQAERRAVVVPLQGLDRLPAPWATWPHPTHVALEAPVHDPVAAWGAYWDWLDAGRPIYPLGPVAWVEVPSASVIHTIEVATGLLRGHLVGGSGPDLWLEVGGARPGELLQESLTPDEEPHSGTITLIAPEEAEELILIADGVAVGQWFVDDRPDQVLIPRGTRWVVAALWTPGGGPWAVTAPIWLRSPASASDEPRRSSPRPPR